MKKFTLALALLASFSTFAQGDAQAGKTKTTTCVACHGTEGNSMLGIYPNLAGQHENYLFKQLKEFKLGAETGGKKGRYEPSMSAMATPLTEQDMADLAAYYASLPLKLGTTTETSIDVGQTLYRFGDKERQITACIACHGPRGNGTTSSGFPNISGQQADYVKKQLETFRSGERNNDLNGMMRLVAKKLTDDEITALSQYVGGLH